MKKLITPVVLLAFIIAFNFSAHSQKNPSPPPAAKPYKQIIDRTFDLTPFIKDPKNWVAEDRFAAWNVWQKQLAADPKAKLEPWNFYGERFSYEIDSKRGHNSNSSLLMRYKVGPVYLKDPKNPYGQAYNDRHSKNYSIKRLPVDLSLYNQLSAWIYVDGLQSGYINFGMEVDFDAMKKYYDMNKISSGRKFHHYTSRSFKGGEWFNITLEYQNLDPEFLKRVNSIILCPMWYGVQPSDNHKEIKYYWDDFKLQHVSNPRKWIGWGADPAVVTVNQLGYKPIAEKLAIIPASLPHGTFYVRDSKTNKVVYEGGFKLQRLLQGDFLVGDFSKLDIPGKYYVQAGDKRSVNFPIKDRPYYEAAEATLKVLAGQRSGCATHLHEEAHMDVAWDPVKKRHVDLVGGYFDAGDTRRFEHNPVMQAFYHMSAFDILPDDDPLKPKLLDETAWFFKTIEKHWKLGKNLYTVTKNYPRRNNMLTDNKIGTADDPVFDGSTRSSFLGYVGDGYIRYAQEVKKTDPARAKQILSIAKEITDRFGHWSLDMNLALYKETGDRKYYEKVKKCIDRLLGFQLNEFVIYNGKPISGMLSVNNDKNDFYQTYMKSKYGHRITSLIKAMEACPEDYYRIYFALKRYADFFVRNATLTLGPWAVNPIPARGANPPIRSGYYLGQMNHQPFYLTVAGRNAELARPYGFHLVHLAQALADPEIEAIAQRTIGQMLGWNPFNMSHISGFGEDSKEYVFTWLPPTKGMIGRLLKLEDDMRCKGHEIWTVTQTHANASLTALDAPCHLKGTMTTAGSPYKGELSILTPSGRLVKKLQTSEMGKFGPVILSGGGYYTLSASGFKYKVPAIAGARYDIRFDTEYEIILEGLDLKGVEPKLINVSAYQAQIFNMKPGKNLKKDFPISFKFDGRLIRMKNRANYTVRLQAKALGKGTSKHKIVFHAANARVEPAETTVEVKPNKPAIIELKIIPEKPYETICILGEIDGDHMKKWEMQAVCDFNPPFIRSENLQLGSKPFKRGAFIRLLDEDNKIVKKQLWVKQGNLNLQPLDSAGDFKLSTSIGGRIYNGPLFKAESGELTDLKNYNMVLEKK